MARRTKRRGDSIDPVKNYEGIQSTFSAFVRGNMTNAFQFSESDRRDLKRSLRAHGCKEVTEEILAAFERHVERYHRKVVLRDEASSLVSAVQAYKLLDATLCTLSEMEELTPLNRRRMVKMVPGANKKLLEDYKEGVDELMTATSYALEKVCETMGAKTGDTNVELKRLCRGVAREWKKATDRSFPRLPDAGSHTFRWQELRQLQSHPLWIVMHSLGITMPPLITIGLEEYAFAE